MSSHPISILRSRQLRGFALSIITCSLMLLFGFAVTQRAALAQTVPPPSNATPLSATINEDGMTGNLNTGVQADPRYEVIISSPPAQGEVTTGGAFPNNFTIKYKPSANKSGVVTFSYQICTKVPPDVTVRCGTGAMVTVTINPVNDMPQAIADSASVRYGQSVTVEVLRNDTNGPEESGSPVLVSVNAPTPDGTATIDNGKVIYQAPAAPTPCTASTQATFTYIISDGDLQGVGTVTITRTCAPVPANPKLKLSDLRMLGNHLVEMDVILESASTNVAAVDFVLNYNNTCVADPDSPTDSMVGDDVTSSLRDLGFYFDAQDAPYPGKLHFIAAKTLGFDPLAGPGMTSRVLATIKFMAVAGCITANSDFTFDASPIFTGDGGTDLTGGTAENKNDVSLAGANNKPTGISLSNQTVPGNAVNNLYIGMFMTTDPDTSDVNRITYAFAPPFGNSGGRFKLGANAWDNDELSLNGAVPAAGVYTITLQATDPYAAFITKTFAINVTTINKAAPTAVNDGPFAINARTVITTLLNNDTDINNATNAVVPCTACTIHSVTNGSKGMVSNLGKSAAYVPTDPKFFGTDVFSYTVSDNDAAGALVSNIARVTVNVSNTVKLGDCNKSGRVEAGDLTATGLEIFDVDGNLWYNIYQGSRTTFSAYGCNANQDNVLDAGDISCTARKIFNAAANCGAAMAASASKATLEVASGLRGAAGSTVSVPVSLRNNGNAVDTAVFALAYDASKLSFNADDASAVSLSDGQLAMVNAVDGRVEIVVTGLSAADGAVANINLSVKENASGDAAISLADSSLGSEGGTVAVDIADGAIQIGDAGSTNFRSLLPIIRK